MSLNRDVDRSRRSGLVRLLRIARSLSDGCWHARVDLARTYRVSRRTIYRDLAMLEGAGFAMECRWESGGHVVQRGRREGANIAVGWVRLMRPKETAYLTERFSRSLFAAESR